MMRARSLRALVVAALAAALAVPGVTSGPAAAARDVRPFDFNGDGRTDLAVGVPHEALGKTRNAGAVTVIYGGTHGLTAKGNQFWSQKSKGVKGRARPYDWFGQVLASGDFDNDGYADLAITAGPDVTVLFGSRHGLTARDQRIVRHAESLAAGDFNGDGRADLALGQPSVTVAAKRQAGRVVVIPGGRKGLRTTAAVAYSQASAGVPGSAETFDMFGHTVTAGDLTGDGVDDLVVGAPYESIGAARGAGAVWVFKGHRGGGFATITTWNQNSPGVADEAESESCGQTGNEGFGAALAIGNFDGDARADLAVGVPNEIVSTNPDPGIGDPCTSGGIVQVLRGAPDGVTGAGSQTFDPTATGLPAEARFGIGGVLVAGDFDGDGAADLAIGIGGLFGVTVLRGSDAGLIGPGQTFTRDTPGIPGADSDDQYDDDFVSDLAAGHYADSSADALAVGALDHRSHGTVTLVYGSATGLDANTGQLWSQDSAGVIGTAEHCEYFGALDGVANADDPCGD